MVPDPSDAEAWPAIRSKIVEQGEWGIREKGQIHYSHVRPIDGIGHPHKLPLTTDCSGWVTDCYNWAGAHDPNGRHYDGRGYTGTLLDHCRHISRDDLQLGDLIVFGPGTGEHVVLVIKLGLDPLVVSHGGEYGPIRIRLSDEAEYHHRPITYLNGLAAQADYVPAPVDQLQDAWNPPTESDEAFATRAVDDS
jgi:hypothetical protein